MHTCPAHANECRAPESKHPTPWRLAFERWGLFSGLLLASWTIAAPQEVATAALPSNELRRDASAEELGVPEDAASKAVNTSGLRTGLNFTGITLAEGAVYVPDTLVAIGPRHIVELLNGRYSIYRKNDGTLLRANSLDQFWIAAGATPPGSTTDSRLLFDRFSRRWFASTLALSPPGAGDHLLLAVSKNSDPTTGWTGFSIPFNGPVGNFADFPTLGLNRDGVFLYTNGSVVVLPKNDLIAKTPSIANATVLSSFGLLTPTGSKLQPIVNLDDAGLPEPIIGSWDVDGAAFKRSSITGDVYSPALDTSVALIPVNPFVGLGNVGAQQPNSPVTISAGTTTFNSSIVLENGVMWGVQGVANQGRAALRWFAIDAKTNVVRQEGLIADPKKDLFMGSLAINESNDVVIGFNESSASQFVSSYAVRGTKKQGRTVFGKPLLLKAGVAVYSDFGVGVGVSRWGDYSATLVDPNNQRSFWTIQQWVSAENSWATQITQLCLAARMHDDMEESNSKTTDSYDADHDDQKHDVDRCEERDDDER